MLLSALGKRTSVAVTLAGPPRLPCWQVVRVQAQQIRPRVRLRLAASSGPTAEQPARRTGRPSPEYATCGDGKVQSPIDIVNPKQTGNPNPVVAYTATQATVVNSGHDLDMVSPPQETK